MTTTPFELETLINGIVAFLWIGLALLRVSGLDLLTAAGWLRENSALAPVYLSLSVVLAYQLGYTVNWLSWFFYNKFVYPGLRNRMFQNAEVFSSITDALNASGQAPLLSGDKSVLRLRGAGSINFLALGLALWWQGLWLLGTAALVFFVISFWETRKRYKTYLTHLRTFSKRLQSPNAVVADARAQTGKG